MSGIFQLLRTAAAAAKPAIGKMIYYGKIELAPPKISDIPLIRNEIKSLINAAKNKQYRNVTVREAWLNTLVTIEVMCWFFMGECIGKRHLIGYKV